MGKIRVSKLGNAETEEKQRKKAEARREAKKLEKKKAKVAGVGMKGGERTAVVEGLDEEALKKIEAIESTPEAKLDKKSKKLKAPKSRSKRYQEALKLVDRAKLYPTTDALELVKKTSVTKFDGTVEVHINLDPKLLGEKVKTKDKEKPSLRGTVTFPHGTGKQVRVAIASESLIKDIESGKIEFDVLVAEPAMMPKLAKVARTLGPKGLMPNPKNGTIGPDPKALAEKLSKGQTSFKTEPENPIIHMGIGKVSFETKKLAENLAALTTAIGKPKILSLTIASTMGPGIKVNPSSL